MRHLVVVEVAGGGEPLSADAALVRLLAAVDASVRVERGRRGEPLGADVAHVRDSRARLTKTLLNILDCVSDHGVLAQRRGQPHGDRAQDLCEELFQDYVPKDSWPPSSPDLGCN